ncbi:MAG: Sec-independent protein translocase protein TatC [Candidatus Methanoperedenaceae archaeon GB50]|nr:MAG: Sec-independent protein translocase protein TatC [Candidatus Methanoperedenaceae archaeon GB50]
MLSSKRRYAIVLVFVVAALLTPPDVGTQLLMAGPLILLYEVSVWVARIFGRKSQTPSK